MNDRIFKALERAGLAETPIASLDYEQQLFALTPQTLVFQAQDDGPLQQVLLRDITRIYSDEAGTLRIETGSRTALVTSIAGYDAGRVQRFFQVVRDTTARAKQLPMPPAGASQAGSAGPAPVFFGQPASVPLAEQLAAAPRLQDMAPLSPQPAPLLDAGNTIRISAEVPQAKRQEASTQEANRQGGGAVAADAESLPQPVKIAAVRTPAAPTEEADVATKLEAAPVSLRPAATEDAAVLARQRTEQAAQRHPELLRRSRSLGGLSATARVLALVLVLGALGMGYVMWQKQSQHIPALWTVTIGIVTAVALLILAEVLRFLSVLGAAVAGEGRA